MYINAVVEVTYLLTRWTLMTACQILITPPVARDSCTNLPKIAANTLTLFIKIRRFYIPSHRVHDNADEHNSYTASELAKR